MCAPCTTTRESTPTTPTNFIWAAATSKNPGSMTASFLLAISPTFLYFSRFLREDIFMAFATLAFFIGLVRFVRQPSGRWWYILMAALGLLYCTKEASF